MGVLLLLRVVVWMNFSGIILVLKGKKLVVFIVNSVTTYRLRIKMIPQLAILV
jgi:hypothetical protein